MTTKAETKRRVVLPGADPGDVYDVQEQGAGRYLLVRLERPKPKVTMSREDCLRAVDDHPLRLGLNREELKGLTREP